MSWNKKKLLLCTTMLSCLVGFSQFNKSTNVIRDPRLDILVEKQAELNKNEIRKRVYIEQGFRIQVISTNDRQAALEAKSTLLKNFADQQSYLIYQSPKFRILFGNFRTQKEAQQWRSTLEVFFENDLLIVPSKIEIKGAQLLDTNQ
jgi:hypothetical protein